MPRNLDPDTIGFLVTDLARLVRSEMDRRISDAGLGITPSEARTLIHAERAGAVRQNVLAERMGVEAMTLSAALDRLETQKLIERLPDPTDRRAKLVHLTDEADGMLERIAPISASLRADASRSIAPDVWAQLLQHLKVVRANLQDAKSTSAAREGRTS
ncbi:MAG: MarR family transcriptional regulator [Pseudaminobacter sp.]